MLRKVAKWPFSPRVLRILCVRDATSLQELCRTRALGSVRAYLVRSGLPRPRTTGLWPGGDRHAVSSKFTRSGPRQALPLPFLRCTSLAAPAVRRRVRPSFASGGRWNLARMSGRSLIHWCVLLCCIAGHCGSVLALQSMLSWQLPKLQQIRKCALQLRNLKQASCPRTVLKIMCTATFS